MTKIKKIALFLLFLPIYLANAQQAKRLNPSEIHDALEKLNFLGSVLYVAAHPDDENTRLIAYMANKIKARTAYLSLTRGDGGQNLIGPELRELLGVIRTQELLAARRVDGGEQLFSRANDFGFSKHPKETLKIWDKDNVLADVVWAIRTFKPDVIINRFDHRTPGTTHGHHTTSAMLSMEAFDISNNKSKYTSQLNLTDVWQAKRIFFNTSWWFYGSRSKFEKADKSNMINYDIGVFYPSKGVSNNEIAALASSQHLCQGFGRLAQRGTQDEYIEFLKGEPLNGSKNLFEGIDTSWNRVKGGKAVGEILYAIEDNFNFKDPSIHLPEFIKAYKLIQNLEDKHWKTQKSKALLQIIEACTGLYLEVSANTPYASINTDVSLNIEAINRSTANITLQSYNIIEPSLTIEKGLSLTNNTKFNFKENVTIPSSSVTTTPYWLNTKSTLGMYNVEDQNLIGKPETPRALNVTFNLIINGTPLSITKPVIHRYSKPDKGELYRPFEIIPEITANISNNVYLFKNSDAQEIEVEIRANKTNVKGEVQLAYPNNWTVYPEKQEIFIAQKGDVQKVIFNVIPPAQESEGLISPIVKIEENYYTKKIEEINYSHIPFQTVLMPSESKIVRLNITKKGSNIGYIEGAGDVIPESLNAIGYNVTIIDPNNISDETLKEFDAIVLGIRAYNTVDALAYKQKHLLNYVKNGGNLIVQYNTNFRLKTENIAPFNLKLSRDRVTDENAEVTILKPDHPILNFPNKITQNDFKGWVQERGLYFPNEWGKEFTPLLAMNDEGETSKKGSLLVADYGKGKYIYTGLSFFREFAAGVPGAFKLFSNLLSAGKLPQDSKIKQ